jgi:hypothetical protein
MSNLREGSAAKSMDGEKKPDVAKSYGALKVRRYESNAKATAARFDKTEPAAINSKANSTTTSTAPS